MADITNADMQALIAALQENTQAQGSGGRGNRAAPPNGQPRTPQDKESAKLKKDSLTARKAANKVLDEWTKAAINSNAVTRESAKVMAAHSKGVGVFAKAILVGAAAATTLTGLLKTTLTDTVDTYRQMMDVGQSFNGSMLQMNIGAAEAALSLKDFSALVKKNSLVIGSIGTQAFTSMSRGLRDSLDQFGMLGLTTEQLNGYLGDYMETQRTWGNLERLNRNDAIDSTKALAIEVTKVSQLTGRSRDEILKASMKAMQEDSVRARMMSETGSRALELSKGMQLATVYMAGLPKESGDAMSKMIAQSVGRGSAQFSDLAKTMYAAGMGSVVSTVDTIRTKIENGTASEKDMEDFRLALSRTGKQQLSVLRNMELSGDANAKQMIELIADAENYSKKRIEENKKQQVMTNTLLRLQEAWSKAIGFIKLQFFEGAEGFGKALDTLFASPEFARFKDQIGALAKGAGTMLTKLADPKIWEAVGNGLVTIGGLFMKFANGVEWMIKNLGLLGSAAAVLGGILGVKLVGKIAGAMNPLKEKFTFNPMDKFSHNGAMKVWVMNQPNGGGGLDIDVPDHGHKTGGKTTPGRTKGSRVKGFAKGAWGATKGLAKGGAALARTGAGKASIGGLAIGIAGGMLIDKMQEGAGKDLAKLASAAGSGAATGAMFGPWGALVGGIVGAGVELISNWDDIKKNVVGPAISGVMGSVSGGISWMSDKMGAMKDSFVTTTTAAWNTIKGIDWQGMAAKAGNVVMSTMKATPAGMAVGAVADAFKPGGIGSSAISAVGNMLPSVSGPSTPATPAFPTVDTKLLENQVKGLQNQVAQTQKENAELRQTFNKLIDLMQEGNLVNRAGLQEMIAATKKGNDKLGNLGMA